MAVAVSGGADSFALLHSLHMRGVPVVALTVDHQLRPEAADEASRVAAWCDEQKIFHETLVWREKPDGNLQANARTARYRLLCQACNRLGLETLVTGHTADDQAETVFMRLRRGSGRGLAGMPETRLIAGGAGEPVTLYRPLLEVRRAETFAYADAHDLPVSHDPSNEDDKFERVRVRALLVALEQQDLLTVEALCRTANEVDKLARDQVDGAYEYEWSEFNLITDKKGYLDDPLSSTESWSGGITLFNSLLRKSLGYTFFARTVSALGERDVTAKELTIPVFSTTISGVTITRVSGRAKDSHGHVYEEDLFSVHREPAALLGRADGAGGFEPIPVKPGEKHLYDRRFIVHVPDAVQEDTVLRPLGALLPRDIATSTLDRQRVSTLPCLSHGDRLTHQPGHCVEFIHKALSGWKQAEDFLNGIEIFEAESLLEERFTGRVIRF